MFSKRFVLLVLFLVVIGSSLQLQAQDTRLFTASDFGLPTTIGQYRVVAVQTSKTIACMPPGVKRLILQSARPTVEDFLNSKDYETIGRELQVLRKTDIDDLEYQVIGSGVSSEDIAKVFNDWDPARQESACKKLLPAADSSNPTRGYTTFQNTNAGLFTDDNAQAVTLTAPLIIGAMPVNDGFFLLNNVWTNADFFLQNGILIQGNSNPPTTSVIVWTDSNPLYNLQAQPYTIPYVVGNKYRFVITYTSTIWWMCAHNVAVPSTYTCQPETTPNIGTHLKLSINTSVFAEVISLNPNWYTFISGTTAVASGAKIYRNGFAQNWTAESKSFQGCRNPNGSNPPNPFIGTLVGGATGSMKYSNMPLQC